MVLSSRSTPHASSAIFCRSGSLIGLTPQDRARLMHRRAAWIRAAPHGAGSPLQARQRVCDAPVTLGQGGSQPLLLGLSSKRPVLPVEAGDDVSAGVHLSGD